MAFQLLQLVIVVRHIVQKSLALFPDEAKVGVKVRGQLNSVIVLEVLVQDLQNVLEGCLLLGIRDVKVLEESPSTAGQ